MKWWESDTYSKIIIAFISICFISILWLGIGKYLKQCPECPEIATISEMTTPRLAWACIEINDVKFDTVSTGGLLAMGLAEWGNCYIEKPPGEFGMWMTRLSAELRQRGIKADLPEDYEKEIGIWLRDNDIAPNESGKGERK